MPEKHKPIGAVKTLLFALLAVASFHVAYSFDSFRFAIVVFLYSLFQLTNVRTTRVAFYIGLAVGMAIYAPQLSFFWILFGVGAVPLWIILSCWLAFFLLFGNACAKRWGPLVWACLAPFAWMGLEYFRSELYYLRFSWLNPGFAFSPSPALNYYARYGVYGIGFVAMAAAAYAAVFPLLTRFWRIVGCSLTVLLLIAPAFKTTSQGGVPANFRVTGVQLEFPSLGEVLSGLDKAERQFPDTELLVLSEYAFTGPVPKLINKWCIKHNKFLVVGAEEPLANGQYYNTVFVIDSQGKVVFQQAKCVPVQFMKDGLPAARQGVWNSPWGKIGFGICYDASYSRVADGLVQLGAEGFIFPTMDIQDWGARQHWLHARVPSMRAAEYGVPVFRLCSSGISQYVDSTGHVLESTSFPGQGEILSAKIQLTTTGHIPPDRWLAWFSVAVTASVAIRMFVKALQNRSKNTIPSVS